MASRDAACGSRLSMSQYDRQQTDYSADHTSKAGNYRANPRPNNFEAFPAISAESYAKFSDGVVGQHKVRRMSCGSPFAAWFWFPAHSRFTKPWQQEPFSCHLA
jgi:hypothetical protein